MSCPDWTVLTAHRFDPRGEAPAGWEAALGHLDGCDRCRREALAADPTLLFQRASEAPLGGEELVAIRSSVRALRGADRADRRQRTGWRRFGSIAAALLLAVLAVLAVGERFDPEPVAAPPSWDGAASMRFGDFRVVPFELATPPMVEAIDRPGARIYELPQEDLSLVMIVDESLDV